MALLFGKVHVVGGKCVCDNVYIVADNFHNVKADRRAHKFVARKPPLGASYDCLLLAHINCIARKAEIGRIATFDFQKHVVILVFCNDIYFAKLTSVVALDNFVALLF